MFLRVAKRRRYPTTTPLKTTSKQIRITIRAKIYGWSWGKAVSVEGSDGVEVAGVDGMVRVVLAVVVVFVSEFPATAIKICTTPLAPSQYLRPQLDDA